MEGVIRLGIVIGNGKGKGKGRNGWIIGMDVLFCDTTDEL